MARYKIVIIDDRILRQKRQLGTLVFDLQSYDYVSFLSTLTSLDEISEYDIIAIHRSYAVNLNLLNSLVELVQKHKKYLILFSGGISEQSMGLNGHYLSTTSKGFYSAKLLDFIRDLQTSDEIVLQKILYGVHGWKLPMLLRYRHLKWQYSINEAPDGIEEEMENIEEMLPKETRCLDESISNLIIRL